MTERISIEEAKAFVQHYHDIFAAKGAAPDTYLRSFYMDRETIQSIFTQAEEAGIVCAGLRVHLGKKTAPTEEDITNEIMHVDGHYNLIIAGVDDANCTITETGEIYDNLDHCPNLCSSKPDFEV